MKLIYSAREYEEFYYRDVFIRKCFEDGDFSAIFSGASGSGKDTVCMALLDVDMQEGRTPIIFDVKMEYPSTIFLQQDVILKNILKRSKRSPSAYITNLWIPYVKGLEKNRHFQELIKCKHPNLRIRPFRIFTSNLVSEDTKNFAVGKSFLQAMEPEKGSLKGSANTYNIIREHIAKIKLCFDEDNQLMPSCGWEYIDFDAMTTNKEVNVISFFFMLGRNSISSISFAIGVLNELLTVGKGTDRPRSQDEVFSIYIPELQIILPRNVKALQESVNVLQFNMLVGLLLMRSFYARTRINLQNLSFLHSDMFSQSKLYAGKTANPKDFSIFAIFGYVKEMKRKFRNLPTGTFINLFERKEFLIVPKSHKARKREPFLELLKEYQEDPTRFLYETSNCFLSELDESTFPGLEYPLDVDVYKKKVKEWLKSQEPLEVQPLNLSDPLSHEKGVEPTFEGPILEEEIPVKEKMIRLRKRLEEAKIL